MNEIRLGSLFDGIGVFPLAAVRCGIVPAWASEIEKAPISITKRHFPGMAHLGDVTKLNGGDIPPVHIITFAPEFKDLTRTEMTELMEYIFSLPEVQRAVRHMAITHINQASRGKEQKADGNIPLHRHPDQTQ